MVKSLCQRGRANGVLTRVEFPGEGAFKDQNEDQSKNTLNEWGLDWGSGAEARVQCELRNAFWVLVFSVYSPFSVPSHMASLPLRQLSLVFSSHNNESLRVWEFAIGYRPPDPLFGSSTIFYNSTRVLVISLKLTALNIQSWLNLSFFFCVCWVRKKVIHTYVHNNITSSFKQCDW